MREEKSSKVENSAETSDIPSSSAASMPDVDILPFAVMRFFD